MGCNSYAFGSFSIGRSSLDPDERDGVGRGELVESVVLPEARSCSRRVDAGGMVACTGSADSQAGFDDSVAVIVILWFRVEQKGSIVLCDTCLYCGVQMLPSFREYDDVAVYVRALPRIPACWRDGF